MERSGEAVQGLSVHRSKVIDNKGEIPQSSDKGINNQKTTFYVKTVRLKYEQKNESIRFGMVKFDVQRIFYRVSKGHTSV